MDGHKWIAFHNGEVTLTWEPLAFMILIGILAWVFCKLFLQGLSDDRKRTLTALFRNYLVHATSASTLFALYAALSIPFVHHRSLVAAAAFVGIACLIHWAYFAIRLSRLCIFIALFFSNMKVAFPLLLVNLGTLILSIIFGTALATVLLDIQVVPLLATSAVFSIVLGIALQDTLGNLFAGIALQLDKPDEIDDWVEILNGGQKWVGRVHEITWRATVLVGFGDEIITIPNRVMAQSTICNFSVAGRPFIRAQTVRIPFDADLAAVKETINESLRNIEGVLPDPAPFCAIQETTESWVAIRVLYYIRDYSSQLMIGDRVYSSLLAALDRLGIPLAATRIIVVDPHVETGRD